MADKAVIFDMDGVLVDSYEAHFESWRRMAQARGLDPMSQDMFAKTFGRTTWDIITDRWPRIAKEEIPSLDDQKEATFREILTEHFPEMPGASELLACLHKAGFALAIGSSGPPANVQVILKQLRNADLFAATVDASQVRLGKPNPDVFLTAAGKLGVKPARCVVVEDAPAGVQAARAAGMSVIARVGTVTRDRLASADLVVDSLREITPQVVDGLITVRRT